MRRRHFLFAKVLCALAFLLPAIGLFPHAEAAAATLLPMNHRVIDAEYSKVLDKIITVSSTPSNQLHIVDPVTGEDRALALSYVPTCVSVGPDGVHAAVGHDARISYIDLTSLTLIRTYNVSTEAFDVVLAGNGYVYVFPKTDQWEYIRCIDLGTGLETLNTGHVIRAGTLAKLHPDSTKIYGADNGLSPDDIERYNITAGTAAFAYDSPYHGDYPMCGNLWMSEDGIRIFTACGRVFLSSEARSEDMTYNGKLFQTGGITHLDHSTEANKVALILMNTSYPSVIKDTDIWIYQYDPMGYLTTVALPQFQTGGVGHRSHAKFVFFNSAGTNVFSIVQADGSAGSLLDYGVASFTVEEGRRVAYSVTASAGAGGAISPAGVIAVSPGAPLTLAISPNADFVTSQVTVDGRPVGSVTSYRFESVDKDHTIAATFAPTFVGVAASAGTGGSITPSGTTRVTPGASLTVAITPEPGYLISDVAVNGTSVGRVTSYTFNNIRTGHTIAATFAPAFVIAPYYPLTPGASWTYENDAGTTQTVTVLKSTYAIKGVRVSQLQYSVSGGKEYYTNDASGIRLHGQYSRAAYRNRPGTYTMIPPITLAPALAATGTTTQSSGTVRLDVPGVGYGLASYSAAYKVEGFETVTVPAGTFEALKLTYSLTLSGSGESSTETGTLYLAKDVGQIRQVLAYSGRIATYELASTNANVHDLAVTGITPPTFISFTKKVTSRTSPVKVVIQNRGPFAETIADRATLMSVVTLAVNSLGSCPSPVPALTSPTKFPLTIPSRGSLTLSYNVTFNCVNDPARSTARDPNHDDYTFTATVNRSMIDGAADSHTFDDTCPRTVTPPSITDPYPDGTIKDRGCGKLKSDGTYGGSVVTDIMAPK